MCGFYKLSLSSFPHNGPGGGPSDGPNRGPSCEINGEPPAVDPVVNPVVGSLLIPVVFFGGGRSGRAVSAGFRHGLPVPSQGLVLARKLGQSTKRERPQFLFLLCPNFGPSKAMNGGSIDLSS